MVCPFFIKEKAVWTIYAQGINITQTLKQDSMNLCQEKVVLGYSFFGYSFFFIDARKNMKTNLESLEIFSQENGFKLSDIAS